MVQEFMDEIANARRKRQAKESRAAAAINLRALAESFNLAADELMNGTLTRSPIELMAEAAERLKALELYRDDESGLIEG